MKIKQSKYWGIVGWAFIIASIWFGWCAYDKMFNYYNPEYALSLARNSYVGGDAYNYIINSNYTTAMCVLCIGCILIGIICIAIEQLRNTYIDGLIIQKSYVKKLIGDTPNEEINDETTDVVNNMDNNVNEK